MRYIIVKYNKGEHYDQVSNFLNSTYYEIIKSPFWLQTRWAYLNYSSVFNKKLLDNTFLWFANDKLVAVVATDCDTTEIYIQSKNQKKELYINIINFINNKKINLVYVDEKDELLKGMLLENGYFKTSKFEEDLLFNNSILTDVLSIDDKTFSIRNLEYKDIDNLSVMISQAFDNNIVSSKLIARNYKYLFNSPVYDPKTHFIMLNGNNVISYSGFWLNKEKRYAMIEPVITKKEFRKRSLSKKIIYHGINELRKLGASNVYVTSSNTFYYKIGFVSLNRKIAFNKYSENIGGY